MTFFRPVSANLLYKEAPRLYTGRWVIRATGAPHRRIGGSRAPWTETIYPIRTHTPDDPKGSADFLSIGGGIAALAMSTCHSLQRTLSRWICF